MPKAIQKKPSTNKKNKKKSGRSGPSGESGSVYITKYKNEAKQHKDALEQLKKTSGEKVKDAELKADKAEKAQEALEKEIKVKDRELAALVDHLGPERARAVIVAYNVRQYTYSL